MEIKKASTEDIPAISTLADKIWKDYYPAIISLEQIDYMLGKMYSPAALIQQMNEGQHFFIMKEANEPIGYISYSQQENGDFFLHKFYIDTAMHRKGTGMLFFNQVIGSLRDITCLRLTVNRQNFKAINFYFKLGFTIEEVQDFDIGNGYFMNDFVMRKDFDRG